MSFSFRDLAASIQAKRDQTIQKLMRGNGFNPDYISLLSMFASIPASIFFLQHNTTAGTTVLALIVLLDLADGYAARTLKKNHKLGQTIDYSIDRMSEALIKVGLVFGGYANVVLALLSLFTNSMIMFFMAEGEKHKVSMHYITIFPTRLAIIGTFIVSPILFKENAINVLLLIELVITCLMGSWAMRQIVSARDKLENSGKKSRHNAN